MVNYNHADYFGVKGIDYVNTTTYDENGVHVVRKSTWHVVGFAVVETESTYSDGHVETTTSYLKHGTGDYAQPMTEEEAGQFIYDNISYLEENSVIPNITNVMKVPAYRFDSTLDEIRRDLDSRVVFVMKILKTRNPSARPMERISSHAGTPEGSRTIIAMGDVSGIIESQKANAPSGFIEIFGTNTMAKISGMVIGIVYCCESDSLSTTEPVAA